MDWRRSLPLLLILAVGVVQVGGMLGDRLPGHDISLFYLPIAETARISFLEYGDWWPLWMPYGFAGTPFLLKPIIGPDSLLGVLSLLIPNTAFALKLTYFLLVLGAGVSMYFLARYLRLQPPYAALAALVYMLSGHLTKILSWGWLTTIGGYAMLPLVWMWGMRAVHEKDTVREALIAGMLFAGMLRLNPDVKVLIWFGLYYGIYLVYTLAVMPNKQTARRVALAAAIILVVFGGLSAQRILPSADYIAQSSRAQTSWQDASGRRLTYDRMFTGLVQPVPSLRGEGAADHIGIVGAALALLAVWRRWRDRRVLFFTVGAVLSILVASNTFGLYYLLWRYAPFFGSLRYMNRSLFMFVFFGALLAAFGARELSKTDKRLPYILVGLVVVNLGVFGFSPYTTGSTKNWSDPQEVLAGNEVLQYIAGQPGHFRMATWEIRGIEWGIDFFTVPLQLEHIHRYDTAWYVPYFNIHLGAAQQDPPKMWGMLNVKYVTAQTPLNVTGLRPVGEFARCPQCFPDNAAYVNKTWGPYLYENELFLPRGYVVPDAMLVVGSGEQMLQTTYTLMLSPAFDPSRTTLVIGRATVDGHDLEELSRFKAVILTPESVSSASMPLLQAYKEQGGILIPDIVGGEQSADIARIAAMVQGFEPIVPVADEDVEMLDFDHRRVTLDGQEGWLVLSEKFAVFDGWRAESVQGDEPLWVANMMNTAVYLDGGEGTVEFSYEPRSYSIGSAITLVTLLAVAGFFGWQWWAKRKTVRT